MGNADMRAQRTISFNGLYEKLHSDSSLSLTRAEVQQVQKRHRCDKIRQTARGSGRESGVSAGVKSDLRYSMYSHQNVLKTQHMIKVMILLWGM